MKLTDQDRLRLWQDSLLRLIDITHELANKSNDELLDVFLELQQMRTKLKQQYVWLKDRPKVVRQ